MYFPVSYFTPRYFGGAAGSSNSPAPSLNPFIVDLVAYLASKGPDRVSGPRSPGAALPAITYQLVTDRPVYVLRGAAGVTWRTYQLSCFAPVELDAVALELSLRAALSGFRGMMGTNLVTSSRIANVVEQYEPNVDGSDSGTYQITTDYRFAIREPIPTFS